MSIASPVQGEVPRRGGRVVCLPVFPDNPSVSAAGGGDSSPSQGSHISTRSAAPPRAAVFCLKTPEKTCKKPGKKLKKALAIAEIILYNVKAFRTGADSPHVALLTDGLGREADASRRNRTNM